MKQKEDKTVFLTNGLYHEANVYRKFPTNEDEIEKIDKTTKFWDELRYMVKNGEIISININAKMRMGKSTFALAIGKRIYSFIKEFHGIKGEFSVKNIAHDQSEYAEKMRDPETTFTVIVVDEENESENTGQDVSVIKAQTEDFSNIHADRYVHTVRCSPKSIGDTNADILLYIDGNNKDTRKSDEPRMTQAKIYYRYWEGQVEYTQLLGHIYISVEDVIHNWEETVKPKFYDKLKLESMLAKLEKDKVKDSKLIEKTEKELIVLNRYIKEWMKKDWYIHYYMKKRKRIDLMTKYKITKPRILKYAPVILKIIERFEGMMPYNNLIKREIIKNNVRLEMKKAGIPQSIWGEELTSQEVMGVLEAIKSRYLILMNRRKIYEKKREGKMKLEDWEKEDKKLEKIDLELEENVKIQIKEYENCNELLQEYNEEEW